MQWSGWRGEEGGGVNGEFELEDHIHNLPGAMYCMDGSKGKEVISSVGECLLSWRILILGGADSVYCSGGL